MDIKIKPSLLSGTVNIPSSKSLAHRLLICAALSNGESVVNNIDMSQDIEATIVSLSAIGAKFKVESNSIRVEGIKEPPKTADIYCKESGSTLRFLIPVVASLGITATFYGEGRLPQRPIDIYTRELSSKDIKFNYSNTMPFSIEGKLKSGEFFIEGDVSSQFITGLLFALPLLNGDSKIIMKSNLESKPYVDMTIESLKMFGVEIIETDYGFFVKGNQSFKPCLCTVEGDFSQAAFFFTANAIGSNVVIDNLSQNSSQGDKKIVEIISEMCYNGNDGKLGYFNADCSDIPDLVPILAVLGCFGSSESTIFNAKRLKIKESDRLLAISSVLNELGGRVTMLDDGLVIKPIENFTGGDIHSYGDHRIAMCAAIAATRSTGEIIIRNADAVSKSYPDFFTHYNILGGNANVFTLE